MSEQLTAERVIEVLGLTPLPEEGGYYRETFRSDILVPKAALSSHSGQRHCHTLIYYLVTDDEFSGLHRVVGSHETFHFYLGDPVRMVQLTEEGELSEVILGTDILSGQVVQSTVLPNVWQGTRLLGEGKWALLGCSVTPGFEFSDFEIRTQQEFLTQFPKHTSIVKEYTRA